MLRKYCLIHFVLLGAGALAAKAHAVEGKIDFAKEVQPLLIEHCSKCHGEKKKLSKLQLHTPEAIQGFHEEELIVAGKPDESELFKRITLPADDKKRMPKGADPLSEKQIELIRNWITQGAVLTSAEAPAAETTDSAEEMPKESENKIADDAEELADVRAASEAVLTQIESTGASVMSLFADSALLQVSFAQAEKPADDAALVVLPAASDQIVWLNLAGSKASPAGYAPLAKLTNLSQLHLEKSTVNDEALAHLAGLNRLHYLNLYETDVTDAGLERLNGLKRLRKLYLWKTKVSYDAAMALQEATPGLEVNLGWDHPEVARRRLAQQLEDAKQQIEEANKTHEEAKRQMEAANKEKEQSEARLKEIQRQLDALDKPEASDEGEAVENTKEEKGEPQAEADDNKA